VEPESCVDIHPPASVTDDQLIDMKEEELSVPTACSLLERKDEVSYTVFLFHSCITAFVEICIIFPCCSFVLCSRLALLLAKL
jgi:hypothetical protein